MAENGDHLIFLGRIQGFLCLSASLCVCVFPVKGLCQVSKQLSVCAVNILCLRVLEHWFYTWGQEAPGVLVGGPSWSSAK